MQRAGLPILTSLDLLISQTTGPALKKIIIQIKKDLESGNALSACFEKHPKIFDVVTVNLIKAGEASGKLDMFLERIVESLEKREKNKSTNQKCIILSCSIIKRCLTCYYFYVD